MAAGDIGEHFPPSDETNRDRASRDFLDYALKLADKDAYQLVNCDITLLAEKPKLKEHRLKITNSLSKLTHLPPDRVSLKATTTERLGFVGREEGLACLVVVLLEKALSAPPEQQAETYFA